MFRDDESYTKKVDVYSIGTTSIAAITGKASGHKATKDVAQKLIEMGVPNDLIDMLLVRMCPQRFSLRRLLAVHAFSS